jgi:hypothetical protein
MDPDPAPDPDPIPFFADFKDAKNFPFFLLTYPQAHYLQSKKFIFLLKFCVQIYLFCKLYISLLNTFMRKRKDPDPGPELYF